MALATSATPSSTLQLQERFSTERFRALAGVYYNNFSRPGRFSSFRMHSEASTSLLPLVHRTPSCPGFDRGAPDFSSTCCHNPGVPSRSDVLQNSAERNIFAPGMGRTMSLRCSSSEDLELRQEIIERKPLIQMQIILPSSFPRDHWFKRRSTRNNHNQ